MLSRRCLAGIPLLFGSLVLADDHALIISDPWIREAPPGQGILAGYMQIRNESDRPRQITAVKSAAFGSVEIHRTVMKDGIARMEAQSALLVPAAGTLTLKPGDLHLMLIDPHKPLRAGDQVELELQIEPNVTQTITAEVRRSDTAEAHHSHHHHQD
jgi:copper(I)-binding protein